ncbi:MAG: hypothetical protein AAFR38_05365 [Planctomycetota bacterium]
MPKSRFGRAATAALAASGIASATVNHPGADAIVIETPHPDVIVRWAANATAVAIGPNHIVTTRHQGGGPGSPILLGDDIYRVAEDFQHPTADLRVCRIETYGSTPADLEHWVDIWEGGGEAGREFVIGGWGLERGGEQRNGLGELIGYGWGDGNKQLRWGTNVVEGFSLPEPGSPSDARIIQADFDRPGQGTVKEATVADGDSGGGWFINDNGVWKLAGLTSSVQYGQRSVFGEFMNGVRIASFADFIAPFLTAPPCSAADVAEPFGVLSRTDIETFAPLWYLKDPSIAALAAPSDIVSQADIQAFLDAYYAGCQ